MDDKKLEQFLKQYYEIRRNIDGARDKRCKDPDNESHPITIIDRLPRKINCRDCNKELESGERRKFLAKNKEWVEGCADCRRFRDKNSNLMMFMHELPKTVARPLKPASEVIQQDETPEIPQPQPESQSTTTETVTILHQPDGSVVQVIERDCHESLIREYSTLPAFSQTDQCDAQELDNEAHTSSHERQD